MKKLLAILMIIAGCALNAEAQNAAAFRSAVFSSASADKVIKIQNSGVVYHRLSWTIASGTLSSCIIKLEKSPNGVDNWSDLVPATSCTTNGFSNVFLGTANYVRISVTSLAGGTINASYAGWLNTPIGSVDGVYRIIGQVANDIAHTGTIAETVLYTLTIPAGSFDVNSSLQINLWALNGANPGGVARYRIRLGGLSGTVVGDIFGTTANANVRARAMFKNRGALNSNLYSSEATFASSVMNSASAFITVDTSVSLDLVITAQLSGTTDTATIKWAEILLAR